MKNSKLKYVVVGLVLLFVVVTGSLFFYISQKIKPEEIRKQALTLLQENFPNANVELGKIDLSLGTSIKANVEKLKLSLKQEKDNGLFAVQDLRVSIPVWAILTGGGTVEVNLEKPELHYLELPKGNNWTVAMGKEADVATGEEAKVDDQASKGKKDSVALPGALANSQLNVKLNDVQVTYKLNSGQQGNLSISKFLIKNLNLNSPTAFEIQSRANMNLSETNKAEFETLIIGEFNLKDLVDQQKLSGMAVIKLNDISVSSLPEKLPEIKTDINFTLDKAGTVEGTVAMEFGGQNKLSTKYFVGKNETRLKDVNVDIWLKDAADMVGYKNPAMGIGKSRLTLKGSVDNVNQLMQPNLDFSVAPDLEYRVDNITTHIGVQGKFHQDNVNVDIITKLLDGTITTKVAAKVDINAKPFAVEKLPPVSVNVNAHGINLTRSFIHSYLYSKKEPAEAEESKQAPAAGQAKKSDSAKATEPAQAFAVPARINLNWENIKIDGTPFSGKGDIWVSKNTILTKSMDFNYSGGKGHLEHTTTLGPKASDHKIDFTLKDLNLSGLTAFLPPDMLKQISGIFSGVVKGEASTSPNRPATYDMAVDVAARNGELKGIDLSEKVNSTLASIPLLKDKVSAEKKYETDGNFEKLIMQGRFKSNEFDIKKFIFVGIDKKVEITGSGVIYPAPATQSADFNVDFVDNTGKVSSFLEKNVGTKVLPLKLVGPGFSLKPDYQYTIKKLADSAYKTKGKQEIKKATEKLKDKILEGEGKEKLNKLFKGLFK